jgi:hypothetical protein
VSNKNSPEVHWTSGLRARNRDGVVTPEVRLHYRNHTDRAFRRLATALCRRRFRAQCTLMPRERGNRKFGSSSVLKPSSQFLFGPAECRSVLNYTSLSENVKPFFRFVLTRISIRNPDKTSSPVVCAGDGTGLTTGSISAPLVAGISNPMSRRICIYPNTASGRTVQFPEA